MTVNPALRNIFKIMDYSQNLYLPNFTAEKPGNIYYYSNMNFYQFITVYVYTVNDVLHSYIYREVKYKKGGNNVVLCLMNHFEKVRLFNGQIFGEINI